MLLKKHTWVIVALQSLLIIASFVTAWLLRFEFSLPHLELLVGAAPLLLLFLSLIHICTRIVASLTLGRPLL